MASTATILSASRVGEYPPTSPRKIVEAQVVGDATQGAAGTPIPASVFGLKFIESCSPLVKSDNSTVIVASPTYDGTGLLTGTTPANLAAGTYFCVIEGY